MPPALPPASRETLPGGYYVLGGASFIPLIGVPIGIAAIVVGLSSRRARAKRLAWLGAAGIMVSVLLYGGLFYFGFVQRGGVYDHLREQLARSELDDLVRRIEFYRLQHGSYPASLDELARGRDPQDMVMTMDPSSLSPRPFYYERVAGGHYYLRGLGPDGRPFTRDDLVPAASLADGHTGLLLQKQP